MPLFILTDAAGIGSDDIDPLQAFVDTVIIANDTGVGVDPPAGGRQSVTYDRTMDGVPQVRLEELVNTVFTPDYGDGPQQVDTLVIPALTLFVLNDGTSLANNGTALPPQGSGRPGSQLNPTDECLVIYDTMQNVCLARDGTGGTIDLPISNPVLLYHEFSHAFRIVQDAMLSLDGGCDPSSPEENAAIAEENDLRTQIAQRQGIPPELRDPDNHCGTICPSGTGGGCCIVASVASGSPASPEVQRLRAVRDQFVRRTEVGYAFFDQLFYDYYSFSPQVCTMMAKQPGLSGVLLEGFVQPLIEFWRILVARAAAELTDEALGTHLARQHGDEGHAARRLAALQATQAYWRGERDAGEGVPGELLALLRERARPSEHVRWALIEPVRIYSDALAAHVRGEPATEVGRALREALEDWAPRMPLDHIWASLPASRLEAELAWCEESLLQSAGGRSRFRRRLAERFGHITAVRTVLAPGVSRKEAPDG